jgi:Protein of unknown function (DUF1573)
MKQLLSIVAFIAVATFANAQAIMTFDITTVDYGLIEKGSDPLRKFPFKNTGTEPLIIKNAKGSCGCTVPTYPKEPVMPGETGVIEVRYDTQREGPFTKTVTLTTNEAVDTKSLTIKGDVKKAAVQETVPAVANPLGGHN